MRLRRRILETSIRWVLTSKVGPRISAAVSRVEDHLQGASEDGSRLALSEVPSPGEVTWEQLTSEARPASDLDWNEDGVVFLKSFIPEEIMRHYEECWLRENAGRQGGWPDPIPYMRHPEVANLFLYPPLTRELESLIGEPAGLHLNLTGWVSTERNWHQDTYLNPSHVGDYYAAVWIALDDISPLSGPFEFVPGSHRWRVLERDKVCNLLGVSSDDHRWPKLTEGPVHAALETVIAASGRDVERHLPCRGDVLIWHGRLAHRGSPPAISGMLRRAAIAHYSGVNHRSDMPQAIQTTEGSWYFPLETDLELYYGA